MFLIAVRFANLKVLSQYSIIYRCLFLMTVQCDHAKTPVWENNHLSQYSVGNTIPAPRKNRHQYKAAWLER